MSRLTGNDAIGLMEAYASVYEPQSEEIFEDFAGIEDLDDDEIDEIVEETIFEMIEEGYDFDEIEEILSEATVTMGRGGEVDGKESLVTTGSGSRFAAQSRLSGIKAKKREENIKKLKNKVKDLIGRVKAAPGEMKQKAHIPVAKYASERDLMPGPGLMTRSSKNRQKLRGAVAAYIGGRIRSKLERGGKKVTSGLYGAGGAVSSSSEKVRGKIGSAVQGAKQSIKQGIRGAALGLARRMKEDVDVYDIILSHLLDEGYADNEEAANVIMVNMSEEWKNDIVEYMLNEGPSQGPKIPYGPKGEGITTTEVKPKQNLSSNRTLPGTGNRGPKGTPLGLNTGG